MQATSTTTNTTSTMNSTTPILRTMTVSFVRFRLRRGSSSPWSSVAGGETELGGEVVTGGVGVGEGEVEGGREEVE